MHADAHSPLRQLGSENIGGVLRMTVDGSIGDQDALFFGRVAAPKEILLEKIAEMTAPDEAVQRTNILDVKPRRLFQHALHLRAVFADDIGIIPSGLIQMLGKEIGLISKKSAVERAEKAESVGRKEDAVGTLIRHHDLGPVHHRRVDKVQHMAAAGEGIALLDKHDPVGEVAGKKLAQHGFDLCVADDLHVGIADDQIADRVSVIRLHVGNDQIVQLPPSERKLDVFKEGLIDSLVDRVEQHGLFIEHEI